MVRLKPALAMAPLASLTVALMLKVPVDVGVPLTVIVLPLSAAVRPAGRPVTVRLLYGARPLLTGMVPLKPAWFTVQAVGDRAPRLGPETLLLMVMVKVPL